MLLFEPKLLIDLRWVMIAVMLLYCPFSPAASIEPEVLEELMLYDKAAVIIALHDPVAIDAEDRIRLMEVAAVQQSVLDALPSGSFTLRHHYRYIPALSAVINQAALAVLQNHPEVIGVALNEAYFLALAESNTVIGADSLHSSPPPAHYTGKGVVVAVLDTGIDTDHPDLVKDIIKQHCIITPPLSDDSLCMPNSETAEEEIGTTDHGSHVTGIITSDNQANTPLGVAPDAKIVMIKNCDSDEKCWFDDIIAALDWLRGQFKVFGVRIINISIGNNLYPNQCDDADPYSIACENALQQLKVQGIITFVAAGNQGSKDKIARPACLSSAVAVGATYDANVGTRDWGVCTDDATAIDQVTCFSNSNALVDIVAPGAMITSSALNAGIAEKGGTSMATPVAAGVAALMLEANPGLTPDEILQVMQDTGVEVEDSGNNLTFKRVNAHDAVHKVRPGQLQFTSPSYEFEEDEGQVTIAVSRIEGSYGTVTVDYQITDETTDYGEDYSAVKTGTLTWYADDIDNKTIEFNIQDDQIYEGENEHFSITLFKQTPSYIAIGTPNQATISIIDNEVATAGVLQLSQSDYLVQENEGDLTITVRRLLGKVGKVSVHYQTLADSAIADEDYTAVSGTLTWADGDDRAKQFTLPIVDDEQFETLEYLTILLSEPINAVLDARYFATVTLEDNDPRAIPPPPPVKFKVSVEIAGSGSGRVISDPVGIQCNNRALSSCTHHPSDFVFHCLTANAQEKCSAEFKRQTQVTLIPQADTDSVFIGWGGALDCADGTFSLLSNQYCIAYMSALYTLTITPSQLGQVKSYNDARQPTGIACTLAHRDQCAQRFHDGQRVIVAAEAVPGAQFLGWRGDCSGKQPTMLVEMRANKTCQAQFAP